MAGEAAEHFSGGVATTSAAVPYPPLVVEGQDLRQRLTGFVRYRHEHLKGDEKGEAQIFNEALFRAFGHDGIRQAGAVLEERLKKNDGKGTAFADLMWKPRCLIEMKKSGFDLTRAYRQAQTYWFNAVPDRPRYVVLCNFDEFWIYDFDKQLDAPMDRVKIDDLPHRWEALSFLLPEAPPPVFGNDLVAVTRDAATSVAKVFRGLRERGIDRLDAQRFVLQSVMAMFAEDIGLLPAHFFTQALADANNGGQAYDLLFGLFREMNTPGHTGGGRYKGTPYFNGGLFEHIGPFELTKLEVDSLRAAAVTNWAEVRPEIFGTLFEQSMDAGERHAQGAHFTSQADIARIVIPTIVNPWRERLQAAGNIEELTKIASDMYSYRVLDPACGSGNFLYVAYREMRRLEADAQQMIDDRRKAAHTKAQRRLSYVSPDHFYGIDRNHFAVEVAKVTMMLAKKLSADELDDDQDVLPLDNLDKTIVAADALFTAWPKADAIIGNPPFLGRRKMVAELGAAYNDRLQAKYPNVGGVSDFVCYWFPLAQNHLPEGGRAGLVATKSIRETSSRAASLDYVIEHGGVITDAVSSQKWSGDAAVTVSIVNWTKGDPGPAPRVLWLNGTELRLKVDHIPASLMPGVDVGDALPIPANQHPKVCFQGQTPGVTNGFTLNAVEREALVAKLPNEQQFIHPFLGGEELLHTPEIDRWVIDLPQTDSLVAQSEAPGLMKYLAERVLPVREAAATKESEQNKERRAENERAKLKKHHANFLDKWWQHSYRRTDMVNATSKLERFIALTIVTRWERPSVYSFVASHIRPSALLQVFPFDDNYSFGVLSSSIHRMWFEGRCSRLETRLRYTPSSVFDTFPWPQTPTLEGVATIEAVVQQILELRERYLTAGMTLAQQYDSLVQPGKSNLRDLHTALDEAVIDAYGFTRDEDLLTQLFALNKDVVADPDTARGPGKPIAIVGDVAAP